MFVVGLIVGPIVGLLLGQYVLRSRFFNARGAGIVVALVLVFLLFAGFISLELRLGIIVGTLAGLLLIGTPLTMRAREGSAENRS